MVARLSPAPLAPAAPDRLYVGVDVAKNSHVAAFLSRRLLKHKRVTACPTLPFDNNRLGFDRLVRAMQLHAPLEQCVVVLERTGHYHRALQQYLLDLGVQVYELHLQRRPEGDKSDKQDALGLANLLYNQVELRVQMTDRKAVARPVAPASTEATLLSGMVRHHVELQGEATRRKNKLTAICDQIFPEITEIFRDPNLPTALAFRQRFGTPAHLAHASLPDLLACRAGHFPGLAALQRLRELAGHSIGLTDPARLRTLLFEQEQLIEELRLIEAHLAALDGQIEPIINATREGQILASIPCIGPIQAAAIVSSIGTIGRFESAAELRSYFGWRPKRNQTGISRDSRVLSRAGNRMMKSMLYLVAMQLVYRDTEWRDLYRRLLPRMCRYDGDKKAYIGKKKALGHVIGHLIGVIYALLKADHDLLASLPEGREPPPPMCYDREVHRAHRQGHQETV